MQLPEVTDTQTNRYNSEQRKRKIFGWVCDEIKKKITEKDYSKR